MLRARTSSKPIRLSIGLTAVALALGVACAEPTDSAPPALSLPTVDEPALETAEPAVSKAEPVPAREATETPERAPERFAPLTITYRVKRGGSMKTIANLYKIHHHEIQALNPTLGLDAELGPKTPVVVFREGEDFKSESVGLPSRGSLDGGMPFMDGPGRILLAQRYKTWGSRYTVNALDRVLSEWSKAGDSVQPVLVGNLSARSGGKLDPHQTHQSGRDVDIAFQQLWDGKSKLTWQKMDARNLDAKATWKLLEMFVAHADVELFFVDKKLQELLAAYARKASLYSDKELDRWLEVVGKDDESRVRHVPGHDDHIHVRFACQRDEARCRSNEH